MTWRAIRSEDGKASKYAITNGAFNVCKVICGGVEWYEAWRLNPRERLGMWRTAAEAKGACR